MEPYISLVKAIIISTLFSWGTSSVVITDQYIYRENTFENPPTGKETKDYKVYDLKRGVIHLADQQMQYRIATPVDAFSIQEAVPSIGKELFKTPSVIKEDLGNYKCTKETKELQRSLFLDGHDVATNYDDISYFAKISWLDKILDTQKKRQFAGFDRQEYSPYHYLVYEVYQYENHDPQDQVMRIIEKSEVDTTLIHTLLSLPISKN